MSTPVKAMRVDDLHAGEHVPGNFAFWRSPTTKEGDVAGLHFWCPCGCGSMLGVEFGPGKWTWDRDREAPTVAPSILHASPGGCGWHGYLIAGEFVSC